VKSAFDDTSLWRLDTFLVPPGSLSGGRVVVGGEEGRHAVRVVRVRPGDRVRLADGEGTEAIGEVVDVSRVGAPSASTSWRRALARAMTARP
jgi:16S rRNA (uracil1498-N3)-methyltransferase